MRDLVFDDPRLILDSLVVSASAGSGKTFTLTALVTATLGRGELRAYQILATTFSEAAASDLRERLIRPLDLLSNLGTSDWEALLPLLEGEDWRAFEAGLKALPLSNLLRKSAAEVAQAARLWGEALWRSSASQARAFWRRTRREAELLHVSTIHSLALGLLGQGKGAPEAILDASHPALLRLLRQTLRERFTLPESHPDQVAARSLLAWAERGWEDLSGGYDGHRDALGHLDPVDLAPLRDRFHRVLVEAERALEPFANEPLKALDGGSSQRRNFKVSNLLRIPGANADLGQRVRWVERQSARIKTTVTYYTPEFLAAIARLEAVSDAWEAWLRGLLVEGLRGFEAAKAEHGLATFGDLVREALQGLAGGDLEPPRPDLLLVDECQDTSKAQDAFLGALGAVRTVRVGDLKQAIYGFRGGDPELLRAHLDAAGEWAYRLPANFRSAPPVVDLANCLVDEVWPRLDAQASGLDGHQQALGEGGLPVGLVRSTAPSRGADLPALADWIGALASEEGWSHTIGAASGRAVRRRALLLRQRTRLPELLQRLKLRGVQPYVVAKEGFWDSPGVRLLMAALEAVAHPDRPAPCAVLLRHLLGMTDGELTSLVATHTRMPSLEELDPEAQPTYREGMAWLQGLRGCGAQELAGRVLVQGGLLKAVEALNIHGALEPMRARRNLAALLAWLMELPASPMAAYAVLEEERAGRERGDLPASQEQADLVIQTAHASKGLEYEDVILPLLNASPQPFRKGSIRTEPSGALALAWKLGNHPGRAYRVWKPVVEARQRRDDLNLLYVAITRARERMCLLLQEPVKPKPLEESKTWAQFGHHLAAAHPALRTLEILPDVPRPVRDPREFLAAPEGRRPRVETSLPAEEQGERARARHQGEQMHAFLRDLLVRWEDPQAFQRRLEHAPTIPQAREQAERFLAQFEARGWRYLRRRAELPLEGAAASGAEGRADLVVWAEDRLHLLDFKHTADFGEEELNLYRAQLSRYADALQRREGLPVEAWLVALKSGAWVRV